MSATIDICPVCGQVGGRNVTHVCMTSGVPSFVVERDRLTLALGLMTSERDALLAENQRLQETVRLREESQIPMIPHGAQQKMDRLEAENQRLRDALEQIAQNTTRSTSSGDTYPSQSALIAREALAGDADV